MLDLCFRGARVIDGAGNPWFGADVGVRGGRIVAVGTRRRARAPHARVRRPRADARVHRHAHALRRAAARPPRPRLQGAPGRHARGARSGRARARAGRRRDDGAAARAARGLERGRARPRRQLAQRRRVPRALRAARPPSTSATSSPTPRCACSPSAPDDRPATAGRAGRDARARAPGHRRGRRRALGRSHLRARACTRATTSWSRSAASSPAARSTARTTATTACTRSRATPTRSRSRAAPACRCTSRTRTSASPATAGARGELLALIDAARDDGVDITLDTYPYLAGATYLHALLPGWVHAGGPDAIIARLRDPDLRERLRVELEETGLRRLPRRPGRVGQARARRRLDRRPRRARGRAADRRLLRALRRLRPLGLGARALRQRGERARDDAAPRAHGRQRRHPRRRPQPHPRGWGTFARYLAVYVRELGVLSLPECVRHMTSLPAQRLGLADRGLVRPGMAADITVFDPAAVRDVATYEDPRRLAEGFEYVAVNGELVLDGGVHTGATPGRAARCACTPPIARVERLRATCGAEGGARGCGRGAQGPGRSGRSRRGRRPASRAARSFAARFSAESQSGATGRSAATSGASGASAR